MKQLKSKIGKLLSKIGNKLQGKPNLVTITPTIEPPIRYDADKFELYRVQLELPQERLDKLWVKDDIDGNQKIIREMLSAELANKILTRHKEYMHVEPIYGTDSYRFYLEVLISKPGIDV